MYLLVSVLSQDVRLVKHQYYSNDKNVAVLPKLTHSREGISSRHIEFWREKTVRIKNIKLVSKI